MKVPIHLGIVCPKWIWSLKTNKQRTCTELLIPVDDVIGVNNVIKGESVSYPQVVWNFVDNYMDVIIYIFWLFYKAKAWFNVVVLLLLCQQVQDLNLREGTNC